MNAIKNLLLIYILTAACAANAFTQSNCPSKVKSVKGVAWLKNVPRDLKLTDQNIKRLVLVTGQILKVEKGGELVLEISCARISPWTVKSGKTFTIPIPPAVAGHQNLGREFKNGGVQRGGKDFVLFPYQFNEKLPDRITIIRPETAIFRWYSYPQKVLLSINIVGEEKSFWSKEVDGQTGYFTSEDLKQKLYENRKNHPGAKLQFKLTIADPKDPTTNIAYFRLFSEENEQKIQELLEVNTYPLSRIHIYDDYGLYIEMAEEYEGVLKTFPNGIDLLEDAAIANDRAGNYLRVRELEEKLKLLKKSK